MPDTAGSKRDPLQDIAELISQAGDASWKTLCRRVQQWGVRKKCRGNNPVNTKVSEEGGEKGGPGTAVECSATCVDHGEAG